ncbi:MAG: site-specific integrase [Cyanobacteria bacterium P01_H01_bin.121]
MSNVRTAKAQAKISALIETTNQRLKLAQMGVQLEQRGKRLSLRGTFPPRPGTGRIRPHQQRVSLGLPATIEGVKQAETDAKIIAAQLLQNTFDWKRYLVWSQSGRASQDSLDSQIAEFEQFFFQQPQRLAAPASAQTTWRSAYLPYLRKLAAIAATHPKYSLIEALYKTIAACPVNSRSRQACCTALASFADFLNLDLPQNLKELAGTYSNSKTKARELPTDSEILTCISQIPNLAWRFVYGIMATYGLRNHEVFFCDYSDLETRQDRPILRVLSTTKTGEHEVWPFQPEWIETFNLYDVQLPDVNTDLAQTTPQRVGQLVTRQFRRYQIPFSPYDLRHAWAVRTIHIGLADTVAAKMMGHSVAVHTRTYHKWITRRDQQQAVDNALKR